MNTDDLYGLAERVIAAAREAKVTIVSAESLTGGAICATLCDVPGASQVIRGAAVTYSAEMKHRVLEVSAERLAQFGPVDQVVAEQMALGARELFNADIAVAVTGVAGPGSADGKPAGTVYIAVSTAGGAVVRRCCLPGQRAQVRHATVATALEMLLDTIGDDLRDK
ncbi:MAG: CinA family protein [Varibaculum sp.]|nr:CinA family protein [Varibaculum sp.]